MKYFGDFEMGEKIVTKGRSITETDIVLFSAFSGDWHQRQTDIEFAKKGPLIIRVRGISSAILSASTKEYSIP